MVKSQFPFLENLVGNPIDRESFVSDEIDLLIGGEFYWSFVSISNAIPLNDKLVALNSKFGYILSGPVEGTTQRDNSNLQIQSKDV